MVNFPKHIFFQFLTKLKPLRKLFSMSNQSNIMNNLEI